MCSSGAFLNLGHAEPPIKIKRAYLNGVEAYAGIAAVDIYIGAAQPNIDPEKKFDYGGGHVIEDLIKGKEVELVAEGFGTDCYPLKKIETAISLSEINQAIMVNPRNCYQNYAAATNSSNETLYTYMGTLLPNFGNVTYSSAGELSPLLNDPYFECIGIGTKVFLAGAQGYVVGEGTQHRVGVERHKDIPVSPAGTLMLKADMKDMDPKFVRGATIHKYGPTIYLGVGIPIPVLNEKIALRTGVSDKDIKCKIIDYGVPSRDRPVVAETNYEELKSGKVIIDDKEVPTSPLSSYKMAMEVAEELKKLIEKGEFTLSEYVKPLPKKPKELKPLKIKKPLILVKDVETKPAIVASISESVESVAKKIVENNINHVPIVDKNNKLRGIVTSWDIANAVAEGTKKLEEIMTKRVITAKENEPIDVAARRMDKYNISGLPVVDKDNRVIGIVTAEDISRIIGREKK